MDFVEQLKSSIDIVDVVGQYVRLKRLGSGARYVGLCPFHTEKTPSFNVHGAKQFYHCFGCGASGDAIKFVMEQQKVSFYEALKELSERYGIPMPKREYSDPETKLRAAVYRMHEIALDMYRRALEAGAGAEARAYLKKRAVARAMVEEFGLSYSDRTGQALVRAFTAEGFSEEQMETSGLVLKRQNGPGFFDRFRGRLMFPIHDESGKVIGFGGRALSAEDEPKYLNSSESPIYRKSHVLYNLNRARTEIRKQDRAVMVEGYMDVIGAWSAGVQIAVATCGTALTSQQVRTLRRFSDKVTVNFDSDNAGVKAAERSIQMLLEESMRVRVLELAGGKDPDEFVKEHGAEAYLAALERAPGYFYWLADRARAKFDTKTAEGKIGALDYLTPAIQRVSDKLERATIANDMATYLGVEAGLVRDHFRKVVVEKQRAAAPRPARSTAPVETLLLNALLASGDARRDILPKLKTISAIERFQTKKIFAALLAMDEAGAAFSFGELQARLDDNERELLARLTFAEETEEDSDPVAQARACVKALEEGETGARRAALKSRIHEAERAGDLRTALELMRELKELDPV